MDRFWINGNGQSCRIKGAMSCKAAADQLVGLGMGDHVIKPEADPLQFSRTRVDPDGVIVIKGFIKVNAKINNRINVTAFLNFAVRIGGIPHERSPSKFKVTEIIGMINNRGTVRIDIEDPVSAPVPHQIRGFILHISFVIIE
jgi:hypothetical protein